MRKALLLIAVLTMVGCMQKQADGTYRVTTTGRDDAAKARDQVKSTVHQLGSSDAAEKIKSGSKQLGKGIEEGVGHAAQVAGAKLQQAGKKAENAGRH